MRDWPLTSVVSRVAVAALMVSPATSLAQPLNIHIPEQDLAKALVTLAVRSGRNIVFSPSLVAGRRSTPVSNAKDFADALKTILTGAHLRGIVQPDGSVIVMGIQDRDGRKDDRTPRHGADPAKPPAPADLAAVVVTARPERSAPPLTSDALTGRLTTADLEATPAATVLEPLGTLAGVAVINGGQIATNTVPVDLAGRGEANYASIRGLEASFNLVTINGVEAAASEAYSRSIQLNLLPGSGLAEVSVHKSLTADMPGDVIGGVIDFRTPSAFEFPKAGYLTLSASVQAEDEAIRYGRDPLGASLAMQASRVFGADSSLGVYASAYYGLETFSNGIVDGVYPAATNGMFAYAVQTAAGASAPGLNPASNLVLTGLDVGLTTGAVARFGGDLSLDWRPNATASGFLRLTVAESITNQATYYSQIYGNLVMSAPIGVSGLFAPVISYVQPRYYYETNPEFAALDTLQIGGALEAGASTLTARAFTSWGETDDPDHFELSGRDPEVAPGFPYGQGTLFASRNGVPVPLLNTAAAAALGDAADYGARRAGEITHEFSNQLKSGAKLSLAYRLATRASLEAGLDVQDAVRSHTYRDYTSALLYATDTNDPSLASLGILSGETPVAVPGLFNFPLPLVNASRALSLFNANIAQNFGVLANAIDGCAILYVNSYNCDTQHGAEAKTTFWLMGRFKLANLELSTGFLYDYVLIQNRFWVLPHPGTSLETPGYFSGDHTIYLQPLPRLELTYQPKAPVIVRAAVWDSYVPPAMYQLGGGSQIGTTLGGEANGGVTTVLEGNPHLKPVQALNLDLAAVVSSGQGGEVSVAGFYKTLRDYIYDSIAAFSNTAAAQDGQVVITRPENGGRGDVAGLELSGRESLSAAPWPWNGFSFSSALTLERSRVNTLQPGLSAHERLLNQPDLDASLQTTYAKGPASLSLRYGYRGPYVAQYGTLGADSALDTWVRGAKRLNLVGVYRLSSHLKATLSVSNLLNDVGYHATIGEHSEAIPSLVYSGRTYLLTTKWLY